MVGVRIAEPSRVLVSRHVSKHVRGGKFKFHGCAAFLLHDTIDSLSRDRVLK